MPDRRAATTLKADARQVRLVTRFHRDRLEDVCRVAQHDSQLLRPARWDPNLHSRGRVPDRRGLQDSRAGWDVSEREATRLVRLDAGFGPDRHHDCAGNGDAALVADDAPDRPGGRSHG